jgi:hypothetical protein
MLRVKSASDLLEALVVIICARRMHRKVEKKNREDKEKKEKEKDIGQKER